MQADGKFSFMINLISLYSLWKYWPLPRDHETVCLVNVNTNSNNFNIFNISQITAFGLDDTGSFKANSDDVLGYYSHENSFLFFLNIQQNTV